MPLRGLLIHEQLHDRAENRGFLADECGQTNDPIGGGRRVRASGPASGRNMALHLGRYECGLTLRELAALTEMKSDAAVAVSLKRYARRIYEDTAERKQLQRATRLLSECECRDVTLIEP